MLSRRKGPGQEDALSGMNGSKGNGHHYNSGNGHAPPAAPITQAKISLHGSHSKTTTASSSSASSFRRLSKTSITMIVVSCMTVLALLFERRSDESLALSLSVDDWSNRLLELYPSSTSTSSGSIPRLALSSTQAVTDHPGSKEPILLEGWTVTPSADDWSQQALIQRVGKFPQYLKDLTVQPLKRHHRGGGGGGGGDDDGTLCVLPGHIVARLLPKHDLLFFTNNQENEPFLQAVSKDVDTPEAVRHITGFQVFSAMNKQKYHSFHRHGESWLGQLIGRRQWWFLPPSTNPAPPRVDACGYLTGASELPHGTTTILQEPGTIIWFPKDWYHATCALDDWTVGIGAQQGRTIRQSFAKLDPQRKMTIQEIETTISECLETTSPLTTTKTTTKRTRTTFEKESIAANLSTTPNIKDLTSATVAAAIAAASSKATKEHAPTSTSTATTTTRTTPSTTANATDKKKGDAEDGAWKWFDGDLNAYYNSLEQDHKRDPTKLADYAVHRWLGQNRSTEEQYRLLDEAATQFLGTTIASTTMAATATTPTKQPFHVLDGGCGLGSALMWMEQRHPDWIMMGYTVSELQHKFISELPPHKFTVHLQSYDELDQDAQYDFIYSIEALIHSPNAAKTMDIWGQHLKPGGIIAILDDFVVGGEEAKNTEGMQEFAKSWLANSLFSTADLVEMGKTNGLQLVQDRDLTTEYDIISLNYKNRAPNIAPFGGRVHQGWMGSKWRQRLTVEGKLTYNLVVLQKPPLSGGTNKEESLRRRTTTTTPPVTIVTDDSSSPLLSTGVATMVAPNTRTTICATVPRIQHEDEPHAAYTEITPQLMSGRGKNGGQKMACISGWYCCNKGTEWWDRLDEERTDNTAFLKLDRDLFGHYIDAFAKHLNAHFQQHPATSAGGGRFLDIGGTGSTASGMTQVTSKFQHFAGPLEYWILDSDPGAKDLDRTLFCNIEDCPAADTCGFDVTFSHTVLEHASRPWLAFDTIARITKKGGLTMHLVPFSYQYHATPDDNYRFSHKALISLLEDRGFEVLEVGYDICTKPENMLRRVDEHYDTIWLTYVIGRKM